MTLVAGPGERASGELLWDEFTAAPPVRTPQEDLRQLALARSALAAKAVATNPNRHGLNVQGLPGLQGRDNPDVRIITVERFAKYQAPDGHPYAVEATIGAIWEPDPRDRALLDAYLEGGDDIPKEFGGRYNGLVRIHELAALHNTHVTVRVARFLGWGASQHKVKRSLDEGDCITLAVHPRGFTITATGPNAHQPIEGQLPSGGSELAPVPDAEQGGLTPEQVVALSAATRIMMFARDAYLQRGAIV